MDNSLTYRKMCYKTTPIQNIWKSRVSEGDIFVLKTCYCHECKDENNLQDECLVMDNSYIIAGNHYNKYYLFNPHLCVRGVGCMINSTAASILVTDRKHMEDIQPFNIHVDEVFWIPRQEDLQKIVLTEERYSIQGLVFEFSSFVSRYNYQSYKQYWLAFAMKTLFNNHWDGENWT